MDLPEAGTWEYVWIEEGIMQVHHFSQKETGVSPFGSPNFSITGTGERVNKAWIPEPEPVIPEPVIPEPVLRQSVIPQLQAKEEHKEEPAQPAVSQKEKLTSLASEYPL